MYTDCKDCKVAGSAHSTNKSEYEILYCERCQKEVAKINKNVIQMIRSSGIHLVLYCVECKGELDG